MGGGYLVVDPTGVTVSNVPAGKRVVNRAGLPQAGMADAADPQAEKTADKGKGGGFFGLVLKILGMIWALPNTLLGLAYGGIGMLFGAIPVWDSENWVLKFVNMPEWMMPSAAFAHSAGRDTWTLLSTLTRRQYDRIGSCQYGNTTVETWENDT